MRMVKFLFDVLLLCATVSADADGASSKSNAQTKPPDVPPSEPSSPVGGDPVGYIGGYVCDSVEDLRISCPDVDLVFRRSYGSWSAKTGSLGYGWIHSYEWRLEADGENVSVYSAGECGPTDAIHTFRLSEPGATVYNSDGYGLAQTDEGGYILSTPDALAYSFSPSGILESLSTWNGTRVTLLRDDSTGNLARVEHSCGKWLAFSYDDSGLLARVDTPDNDIYVETTVSKKNGTYVLEKVSRHNGATQSVLEYAYDNIPAPGRRDAYSMPPRRFPGHRPGKAAMETSSPQTVSGGLCPGHRCTGITPEED